MQLDASGRSFAVGDRVVASRNDRRLGVVNGDRGEVTGVDLDRRTAQLRLSGGATVNLDAAYLEDGHLDHGYALTAHKAQGATVDRAFVLGSDDLYREWGYTALSRHRDEARFYLVSPASVERHLPGREPDEDPIGRQLVDMLGDSHAKTLAVDHVPAAGSDAARDALTRFALLLADEARAERELESAERTREKSRLRLEEMRSERAGLGRIFHRHERAALDSHIAGHERALDFWQSETARHEDEHAAALERRDTWLLDHGEDTVSLLLAEDPGCDELRDEIVARLHAEPSLGLHDRDEWSRATVDGLRDGPRTRAHAPES